MKCTARRAGLPGRGNTDTGDRVNSLDAWPPSPYTRAPNEAQSFRMVDGDREHTAAFRYVRETAFMESLQNSILTGGAPLRALAIRRKSYTI